MPDEAEEVVRLAKRPYPVALDDEKWLVVGRTRRDRLLHVIFVRKAIDEIDLAYIDLIQAGEAIQRGVEEALYVIHAMPASAGQARLHRRRTQS